MNSLYIIGNGFDLHHGLDTHYRSFGLYLQDHYGTIYDQLLEYFGLPHIDKNDKAVDPLWRDFEHSLSLLDVDMVYEAYSGSIANPGAPHFRDRDWNTFAIDMEMVVDSLTKGLIKAFHEFISQIDYTVIPRDKRISLGSHALFLSFNYTDTLESYYGISDSQITYIHGKAVNNDEIILGHGVDANNFTEEPPKAPAGLSDDELELWEEEMNDRYDYSFELGKTALQDYFSSSYKDTQAVIRVHMDFFASLENIDQVFILGHSLSDVDFPYFEKIITSIRRAPKFTVSYLWDEERLSHTKTLCNLGIHKSQIRMTKMEVL
ncbi:bacteriophage abortive infection AbiH family protein [Marinimicrobium agarilyticum]|uniref:bacteriophage abortive infection AbiH family protein n=1 Tax=Marinimicrobium agarilyticum TaxID=306546 RepID=UPI0003FE5767|nr:bacteriophage abortive infection AbiH family protein [Marinimicrobium agarilyticum]